LTAQKKGLGKGLGALLTENTDLETERRAGVLEVDINRVEPNKDQPRKYFEDAALHELAASIQVHGVIQPLLVKKENGYYSIIAGERRWRAARIAKLQHIPVIIKDYNDVEVLEVALIENIQRADLNPMEEASSYKRLLDEYNLTQEEVSQRVSKSRSAIANTLRLLKLDPRVQVFLSDNKLSAGHARALLPLSEAQQFEIAEHIMENELNVRDTEAFVQAMLAPQPAAEPKKTAKAKQNPSFEKFENDLKQLFGAKVSIKQKNDKGRIEIAYASSDELDRLLCLFHKLDI